MLGELNVIAQVLLLRYCSKQPGVHACRMALEPERPEKGILCHGGQGKTKRGQEKLQKLLPVSLGSLGSVGEGGHGRVLAGIVDRRG